MQIEVVDISSLSFDPANARKHPEKNLAAIEGSLRKFGQRKPIVTRNNVVIAGNGTLAAAKKLGWQTIQIVRADDLSATDAAGFALADNRTAEIAEWDVDALQSSLKGLLDDGFDLAQIGFDAEDLSKLLPEPEPTFECDPDDVPENVDTRCKPGDLWQLGNHRLLCGDSTNVQHVERLMGGEKADMVWTDPPYNYAGRTHCLAPSWGKGHKELKNSEWDKDFNISEIFPSMMALMSADCAVYICTSHFLAPKIWEWMDSSLDFFGWVVWVKPNPMPSFIKKDWTWAAELICYGRRGKPKFNYPDGEHALNWWEINIQTGGREHPTQKPVGVPLRAIEHHSHNGQIVADLFLGSGSTLIACEKTNRKCYGMEIDPKYCDVILARWEKFTGKKAELLKNSEQ